MFPRDQEREGRMKGQVKLEGATSSRRMGPFGKAHAGWARAEPASGGIQANAASEVGGA